MFDTVIVPLDTSLHAEDALPVAAAQARRLHASLVLFHVIARPEMPVQSPHVQRAGPCIRPVEWRKDEIERATRLAQDYLDLVKRRYDLPRETITRIAVGEPIRRITAETNTWPHPLVVMTTGDSTIDNGTALSAVASHLLLQGKVPVLGIRDPVRNGYADTMEPSALLACTH